jgi:hypothetical protein
LLGEEPIIIEHFLWVRGVFMGLIMGSQNIMGLDYGSNFSDTLSLSLSLSLSLPLSL